MAADGSLTRLNGRWSAWLDNWIHLTIILGILVAPTVSALRRDVSSHPRVPRVASREATLEVFGNELPGTTIVIDLNANASSSWTMTSSPGGEVSSEPSITSQTWDGGAQVTWSTSPDGLFPSADPMATPPVMVSSAATSDATWKMESQPMQESTTTLTTTTTVTVTVTSASGGTGDSQTGAAELGLTSETAADAQDSISPIVPTSNIPCPMLTTDTTGLVEDVVTSQASRVIYGSSEVASPATVADVGTTSVGTPSALLNTSVTSNTVWFDHITACGTEIWNGTVWNDVARNDSCPTTLSDFAGATNATWRRYSGGPAAFPITGAFPYSSLAGARFRREQSLMSVIIGGILVGLMV